ALQRSLFRTVEGCIGWRTSARNRRGRSSYLAPFYRQSIEVLNDRTRTKALLEFHEAGVHLTSVRFCCRTEIEKALCRPGQNRFHKQVKRTRRSSFLGRGDVLKMQDALGNVTNHTG